MNRLVIVAAVVLLPILVIVACRNVPIPPIIDLKLVSVVILKQSEIPQQDKYWDASSDIREPLMRVTFSSGYDLQHLAHGWHYYVGQKTSFCKPGASNELKGFPSLHDDLGFVDEFLDRSSSNPLKQSLIPYHVYFDIEQHGIYGFTPYDLVQHPGSVCIQVGGYQTLAGEIPTVGFRSNIIIVPKADIVRALKRAGYPVKQSSDLSNSNDVDSK